MKVVTLACVLASVLTCTADAAASEERPIIVLSSLAPLSAIANSLTEDTSIRVKPLLHRPVPMASLPAMLARPDPQRKELAASADAVLTIGGAWPGDPSYATARGANIRIVEIDASQVLESGGLRVPVITKPQSVVFSQPLEAGPGSEAPAYPWMGLTTAIAMAEIVVHELNRLAPDQAPIIDRNLADFRVKAQRLKAEYELAFADVDDPTLFLLTDRFGYLTNDFGLPVDGYFLKQDARWTDADYTGLSAHLKARGIKTVIHHWQPSDRVQAAIEAGGARLVVLSSGETDAAQGADAYFAMIRSNLEALKSAFPVSP